MSEDFKFHYNRGINHLKLADYRRAIKDFNQAIILNHKFAPAYAGRGRAYLKLGDSHLRSGGLDDYKIAIKDFNQAIILNPRITPAPVYLDRGVARSKLGDYQGAIVDYTEAISHGFTYANVYYNRGNCHGKLSNYHEAIADLNQAIKLDPNYARAYYKRGITWACLYDKDGFNSSYDKAVKNFNKAKKLALKKKDMNLHKSIVKALRKLDDL